MSKIRANFISSKNDNKAVEFTSGIVVGGAVTATNFDFNAEVYNVGTGASISNPANNVLALGTNNTEKVRITSTGNLGVGNDGSFPIFSGTNDRTLILGTGSEDSAIQIHSGTTHYGGIYFGDATSSSNRYRGYVEFKHGTSDDFLRFGTDAQERLRITSGGDVEIADGNLKIGTSGHGIDFSVTGDGTGTVDSELLDEYEEGTFLPTIIQGFSSANMQYQAGRYTRIGNLVYCDFYIRFNTGATANGSSIQIGGLPFNISTKTYGVGSQQFTRGLGHTSFQNLDSNSQIVHFYGAAPQNYFSCYIKGDQPWTVTTSSGGANGAYIIGAFQYHAD